MYHYAHYREDDPDCLLPIVQAYPLGLIVTCTEGQLSASHIPFMIDRGASGALQLLGHIDRSNPQVAALDGAAVYVVFTGPNTYISPTVYVTRQLPTWNYIAVHVSGRARIEAPGLAILDDIERLTQQLARIMHHSAPFFTSARYARAAGRSDRPGVLQLSVQRVWG